MNKLFRNEMTVDQIFASRIRYNDMRFFVTSVNLEEEHEKAYREM